MSAEEEPSREEARATDVFDLTLGEVIAPWFCLVAGGAFLWTAFTAIRWIVDCSPENLSAASHGLSFFAGVALTGAAWRWQSKRDEKLSRLKDDLLRSLTENKEQSGQSYKAVIDAQMSLLKEKLEQHKKDKQQEKLACGEYWS